MEGASELDIGKLVTSARKAIGMLNPILWSSNIQMKTKHLIYNAIVQNILLYAAETWTISEKLQKKIAATEMGTRRKSEKEHDISLTKVFEN